MRRPLVLAVSLALAVAGLGAAGASAPAQAGPVPAARLAAAPTPEQPCGWRETPPRTYDQVVWVVLENHSFGELVGPEGSPQRATSPYLNELADACGLATDFRALRHPSLPNYLAMVSGSTGGVRHSCLPRECPQDRRTIFDQLRDKGETWRVYAESMTRPCLRRNAYPYVARHNPPLYFPSVRGCERRDLPMGSTTSGALVQRAAAGRLPALTVVIPDQCSNTHDCPIETGDRWLSEVVPRLLAGPDYTAGRMALVVTYDEGFGGRDSQNCRRDYDESCHVVTVVVSPTTQPGTRVGRELDHYSLLETTERMLGIRQLLGHAGDRRTRSMRGPFDL